MKRVEGATVKHARRFVFKRWDNFREARRRIALWVLAIGIVIGATGMQYLWYSHDYRTSAFAEGGTYAEGVLGPVNTLNPIFAQSSAEEAASQLLFSRLLTYDQTGHLNYDLADSMKVSNDNKTYTLSIRPDAKWSDGVYVRARDVVFTVGLLQNAATRSTVTGWDGIKVTAVDDLTVSFELPAVYAAFPHALRFLPILPEHILRDVQPAQLRENDFSNNPVGSGPYTLRLLQDIDTASGRKVIHLARSKEYYGGQAKLDRIQLYVYKDTDSIKRALAASEVNAASDLPVLTAASVDPQHYEVDDIPINSGVYALFNTDSPTLQDKKVRQALQIGTDTTAVRSAISNKLPELHLPFLTSQITGAVPAAPIYNPTQAAQLLDDAGWKMDKGVRKKNGQPLTLAVVTTKNPDFEKALDVLSVQWHQLGVTTTTQIVDPSDPSQNVAQNILQPRQYDVLLYQLTIGADPDVYAYWHSSQASGGFNFANYKSSIGDDALVSARARLEPELRNAKYITFAKQWLSDAPAIGLYQSTVQYVHTNNVHTNLDSSTLISAADRYNGVLYWSVGSRSVFTTP
ncbi:MAG TPA: peptide ABC transporter substrate-binding protein [Dongiaceae bacterium]|nr:peptide ABC transporter substrate-binding protein [Dongiaceae bacterium]